MEDEVDIFDNKFRYIKKIIEYSEPVVFSYKINEAVTVKTSQPLMKINLVIKNPLEGRIGTTIKLSKSDETPQGLILFGSNAYRRLQGIDGEIYYSTYVDVMDLRTRIEDKMPVNNNPNSNPNSNFNPSSNQNQTSLPPPNYNSISN